MELIRKELSPLFMGYSYNETSLFLTKTLNNILMKRTGNDLNIANRIRVDN